MTCMTSIEQTHVRSGSKPLKKVRSKDRIPKHIKDKIAQVFGAGHAEAQDSARLLQAEVIAKEAQPQVSVFKPNAND